MGRREKNMSSQLLSRRAFKAQSRPVSARPATVHRTTRVRNVRQAPVASRCSAPRSVRRTLTQRSVNTIPARNFFRGREPQEEKVELHKLDPHQREAYTALQQGRHADAHGFHPDAGLLGDSGLWKKYGFVTTLGFGAVAAIS